MGDDHLYGQEHEDRYRATDGQEGYYWKRDSEIPVVVLERAG